MPLYDFVDTETGEQFEHQLKMAEKEEFLAAHPNLRQIHIGAPSVGDPHRMGRIGPSEGFKEVLRKVDTTPGSILKKNNRYI